MNGRTRTRLTRATWIGVAAAVVGLLLFVYSVRKAGIGEIMGGIQRVGFGFALLLALSGLRLAVRALAWTACLEPPDRLKFSDAIGATLIGEALGNMTPLGSFISEPTKAVVVRHRTSLVPAFSALVVENIFYSLSVALVIAGGAVALLLGLPIPDTLRLVAIGALSGVILLIGFTLFVILAQATPVAAVLGWFTSLGAPGAYLADRLDRIRRFEDRIYSYYARNRGRVATLALLEAVFHVAGVAEVYFAVAFMTGSSPTLLAALVLESTGRVINVVFKYVPLKLGVDEAGAGLLAGALNLGTATGVTLAIVRKARVLVWTAFGVALLARRGLSARLLMAEAETFVAGNRPD